jgi:hypothetical protein
MIDIQKILQELKQLPDYDDQISLQTVEGFDYKYGTGRLNDLNHSEEDFNHFCFPELEYTNSIIEMLGMYRTRIMKMKPKTCYSYHQDPTQRIHIPIHTNENCFMVIEDKCYWYPADGNYYLADTTKKHTFVNASREERIHIVGCTSSI